MNAAPRKLSWTISTLHFFTIANLAAGALFMLTGTGILQALVELYPIFGWLAYGKLQASCIAVLLTSALMCQVGVYALSSRKSWAWMLSMTLLVLMALGWSAGGLTLLVAGVGIYGLLDGRTRKWLSMEPEEVPAPVMARPKTIRLD
ncbi:hypothetical protein [Deinococcus cellulosilyticus]|nr:hypothetical protein [Deinococcus cellulosilyticus]